MSRVTFLLVLLSALGLALVQGRGLLREAVFGTRIDLLPVFVTYVALRGNVYQALGFAALAGVFVDSLSASPLGLSLIAYSMLGAVLSEVRNLVLRNETVAQIVLGAGVAVVSPILGLAVLWGTGFHPVVGWGTVFQIGVMGVAGGVLAPAFFQVFDWLEVELTFAEEPYSRFRSDVEIKRGKG